MTGPNGFIKALDNNQTLESLEVGEYTITVEDIPDTEYVDFMNGGHSGNQAVLVNECIKIGLNCEYAEGPLPTHDVLKISQFSDRSHPVDFAGSVVTGSQNRVFLEIYDPNPENIEKGSVL